jgi:hypothetical protein
VAGVALKPPRGRVSGTAFDDKSLSVSTRINVQQVLICAVERRTLSCIIHLQLEIREIDEADIINLALYT